MPVSVVRPVSALLGLGCVLLTAGCSAPANYYRQTAYMTRLGEETRRQTGRRLGSSELQPGLSTNLAFDMADGAEIRLAPVALTSPDANVLPRLDPVPTDPTSAEPIGIDRSRLIEFLRRRYEVAVVDTQALNGRIAGSQNVLRVEFLPRARSDESLMREFALICAAVQGMDDGRSIDTVVALATSAGFLPWLSMRADLSRFDAYQKGTISLEEWRRGVEIARYGP
ncbi:hypothetical protein FJZ36_14965 [Candidatus Poribacteria bacterium]|nr:hypothetical protein [Candidatus Poribacteria bacterium]